MQSNISRLPNILILIPFWSRPQISEICFWGLDRIRKHRDGVGILAVISEDEYKTRCAKHDVPYTFFENQPLGRKKNHGLKEALKLDWDFLMELNSDDLIKNELLDIYDGLFSSHQFIGLRNFCFLNSKTREMRQYQSQTLYGIGRCYSRQAIEKAGWTKDGIKLWKDEATAGMDNWASHIMELAKIEPHQVFTEKPLAVDIKSDVNIWKWNPKAGQPYKYEEFKNGLSDKEIECLESL